MHIIGYGRIEELTVRQGEPIFTPAPIVEFDIKPGRDDNGPRPDMPDEDFTLKSEIIDMFVSLDGFGDCVIAKLEIRGGLQIFMVVRWLPS